jgi:hypothetical protein
MLNRTSRPFTDPIAAFFLARNSSLNHTLLTPSIWMSGFKDGHVFTMTISTPPLSANFLDRLTYAFKIWMVLSQCTFIKIQPEILSIFLHSRATGITFFISASGAT